MASLPFATASACGLLYEVFNGSVPANQGHCTLFIPPADETSTIANYCNQITLSVTNTGQNQVPLLAPTSAQLLQPMTPSTGGSWLALAFPSAIFANATALSSLTLTATYNGSANSDWSMQVVTIPDPANGGQETPVLIVYLNQTYTLAEGDVFLLSLQNIPTGGWTPSTQPLTGAFFWNEASGATNDARLIPQFWMIASAPDPAQMTASMPLVAGWQTAQFAIDPYGADFSSADISRPVDAAYASPAGAEVLNNLALALDFATQVGPISAGAGTGLTIGFVAADKVSGSGAPFLGPQCGLLDTSTMGDPTLVVQTGGGGWQIAAPTAQGLLYSWAISFPSGNIVPSLSAAQVAVQLDTFLSATQAIAGGPPPYATACVVWWTGVPGAVDGCITLPLMAVPPVPAAVSLELQPASPMLVKDLVGVSWATYAALSQSLVQVGSQGDPFTLKLDSSQGSRSVVANPFADGPNLNSKTIAFYLSLESYGGGDPVKGPQQTLALYQPPSPSIAFTGELLIDATNSSVQTQFTFTVPRAYGQCTAIAIGKQDKLTTASGATGKLTTHAVGGALDFAIDAPGGPYQIANAETTRWTPYAPPSANTLVVFPYLPAATTPSLSAGFYVWQPGYALRPLSALTTGTPSPYSALWNNVQCPAMTLWPYTASPATVNWGYGASSNSMATLQVSWGANGTPGISLEPDIVISDVTTPQSTVLGPLLMGGTSIQATCVSSAPPNNVWWGSIPVQNQWSGPATINEGPKISSAIYVRALSCPWNNLVVPTPLMVVATGAGGNSIFITPTDECSVASPIGIPSDLDVDQPNAQPIVSSVIGNVWQLSSLHLKVDPITLVATPLGATVPYAPQGSNQQSLVPVSVGRFSSTIFYAAGTLDGSVKNSTNTVGIACYASPDGQVALPLFVLPAADQPFIPTLVAVEPPQAS